MTYPQVTGPVAAPLPSRLDGLLGVLAMPAIPLSELGIGYYATSSELPTIAATLPDKSRQPRMNHVDNQIRPPDYLGGCRPRASFIGTSTVETSPKVTMATSTRLLASVSVFRYWVKAPFAAFKCRDRFASH